MDEAGQYIKKLGERIVALRKERRMMQIDLAVRLDIEDSALRRIEKGRTNPTLRTIFFIAKELDVSPSELLRV